MIYFPKEYENTIFGKHGVPMFYEGEEQSGLSVLRAPS